jgi:uncharacterized sulfatase
MSTTPNIVWITLDSIRADHTAVDGYERDTTPYLDRIASLPNGKAFSECITHAMWSLPSITSMLTGTYPSHHGTGLHNEVLPSEVRTVPELLSERGWRTSAISANEYLSDATGLSRGFDRFTQVTPSNLLSTAGVGVLAKFAYNIRRHSAGFTTDLRKHSGNFVLNEIVKRELSDLANSEQPFFLYAHYRGAHHPYYPPLAFREAFTEDIDMSARAASEFTLEHTADIYEEIAAGCEYSASEWDAIGAMYDASIKHCDALMGDLFAHLRSLDPENTVFVVTSDHGDLLGEYDLLSHKLVLHDGLVRVPLVVHGSEALLGCGDDLLQHADLMKTILSAADVPTESFHGVDLRSENRAFAVSQRGQQTYERTMRAIEEHRPDFDTERFHSGLLTSLRTPEFKYLHSGERSELFGLPDEGADMTDTHPESASTFESRFEEWMDEHGGKIETDARAEHSNATKRRLRNPGYVVE